MEIFHADIWWNNFECGKVKMHVLVGAIETDLRLSQAETISLSVFINFYKCLKLPLLQILSSLLNNVLSF